MGAKQVGARRIVAIDVLNGKRPLGTSTTHAYHSFIYFLAEKFGATDFVNPNEVPQDVPFQQYLVDKFDGGFDYTFECIGNRVAFLYPV